MKQYGHGGDVYTACSKLGTSIDELVDFSANINPFGIPEAVKEALSQAIEEAMHYPDAYCRALTELIATHHQTKEAYILCGNGAADLIFRLVYTLKPHKGQVCAPTFSEYELALRSMDAKVCYYHLKAEHDFKLDEAFIESLTPDLDILFLCNPNNPTGVTASKEFLIRVLDRCKRLNSICMVDECFNDFIEDAEALTLVPELENYPNLVILKAFTKMYAIPGVRLGYALSSNTALLEGMYAAGQCWSVSSLAQAAGCAAIKETAFVTQTVTYIKHERKQMIAQLSKLGYKVYPSEANYILFHGKNIPLDKLLYEEGILIRNCDNYKGLDKGYFRVAVKQTAQNEKLMALIERMTKQWENH